MSKKETKSIDHPLSPRKLRYRLRRERYRQIELENSLAAPPEDHAHEGVPEAGHDPTQHAHGHSHGPRHELEKTIETLREQMMRMQAEFENYRKRARREKEQTIETAGLRTIEALLPVLDNFRRAVQSGGDSLESFRSGIALVEKQFEDILAQQGLERIDPKGQPFDPKIHEAVGVVADSGLPDDTVAEVFQSGYALKGRLIRPAMVRVARAG